MAGTDQRDARTWVVLELTRSGEQKVEDGTLAGILRAQLRVDSNFPVFIPVTTYVDTGSRVSMYLLEGYAFIASGLSESAYINLERNSPYIRTVLTTKTGSIRALSVIPDSYIQEMRHKLSKQVASTVAEGNRVEVTDGMFRHLDGEVILVAGEDAHVRVTMRSLDLIAKVPRIFLTPVRDDT